MPKVKLEFEYGSAYCNRENSIPVFLRCQGVRGSLKIENQPSQEIDKVKIVLIGTILNCLGHHNDCSEGYEAQRFVAKDIILNLVEAYDWPTTPDTATENDKSTSFPFDFPLYRKPWESQQDVMGTSGIIPSSLSVTGYGCRSGEHRFTCTATSQIRYELQAFAYGNDELVEQIVSTVTIYDTENPNPPPIYEEHFQGEYICAKEKHLKKLGIKGAKLSIRIAEPKPLEIQPKSGLTLAAVPIRLTLHSKKSKPLRKPNATPLDVRAISLLKTSTYLSVGKMSAHPTITACHKSPFLAAHSRFASKRVRNLRVDKWQQDIEKPGTWTRDLLVFLPVIENSFPAPSFFTPFVARRYSVALRLDVKSSWGDAKFRFDVPVQIVYPETPVNYEHIYNPHLIEECTTPVDDLPIYIR